MCSPLKLLKVWTYCVSVHVCCFINPWSSFMLQLFQCLCQRTKQEHQKLSNLFPVQRVELLYCSRVQLDGLGDVRQHLFEGVRRLLVQENPHCLSRLHAAADHRHQLGFDEVFALSALSTLGAIFGDGRRHSCGCRGGSTWPCCSRPSAGTGLPAWDGDLGVVDLPVRLVGGTNVALAWAARQGVRRKSYIKNKYCKGFTGETFD